MRYLAKFGVNCFLGRAPVEEIREVLRKHGLEQGLGEVNPGYWRLEMTMEKSDPRYDAIRAADLELRRFPLGTASISYTPVFEPIEVDEAELLRLYADAVIEGPHSPDDHRGVSPETMIIDKGGMGKKDIAATYHFDIIVSARLRSVLIEEALTGWETRPVLHKSETDEFPPLFHLVPTNTLPAMAQEMEFREYRYTNPKDNLYGTIAILPASPLTYARKDLTRTEDFNYTQEEFGDAPVRHHFPIITQRAWRVLKKHKIEGIEAEPVVVVS